MNSILVGLNGLYFFYITGLGLMMFRQRKRAVRSGAISGAYFKDYQGAVPAQLKVYENHFNNQFQVPLVFMVLSSLAIALKAVSVFFIIAATTFVVSRFAHSWAHLRGNNVLRRAYCYFFGVIIIASMWLMLVIESLQT